MTMKMTMAEFVGLEPCPFCGGEAEMCHVTQLWEPRDAYWVKCKNCRISGTHHTTEAEAIAAWNSRAAMEFDNWFYLPKPKEPIVEVAETTHAWDGTKVKTDVFYQVQEQAVINWAKELDEHIIKRICEVWNSRAERTCRNVSTTNNFRCSECDAADLDFDKPSYCHGCGAKVVGV